jgi:alpha-galactosidase
MLRLFGIRSYCVRAAFRRLGVFELRFATGWAMLFIALVAGACIGSGQQASDVRTPKPPMTPHLNGPKVYGVRPGHPFLYRIPCTGNRPMRYAAKNLPHSLQLDQRSGIISGNAPATSGVYVVTLQAANALGKDNRPLKIVVGDTIGLTPQMGWNDWYTHYEHIADTDVRNAASAMIASGMADFGYQYVDIDDCWARKPASNDPALKGPARDAQGNILPNTRFPDMRALTNYIHSLGLKTGVYSSPGPQTCARFEGSYEHEEADAQQFAAWGFDLLKYDWCTYGRVAGGKTREDFEKPYIKMGGILKSLDRDVVFNLCQYGNADVWKWGKQVGGNSWRISGDVGVMRDSGLPGFYQAGFASAALSAHGGPGGWNDPDYILIGTVGDATNIAKPARLTSLTHEEQYSYMSMWSVMAAPLIFSGDMTRLDNFTLNILCNSEVIDIDQDSLGKQGVIVRKTENEFILEKPLEDGSVAVGLFNLTNAPRSVAVDWQELGLTDERTARDVWRQQNLGTFAKSYSATVPEHGVMLVRFIPVSPRSKSAAR